MADQEQGNIRQEYNNATVGLNLDQTLNQVKKGVLTYALNAAVENFDANSINYQNEEGNEFCLSFPEGYALIGKYFIPEKNKHIFFLTNPSLGDSQIGYMDNNDCLYHTLFSAPCLNFNINHPIHKCVHKITNCTTEIYWTDGYNPRRYLDINDLPKILKQGSTLCNPIESDSVDCNQLKIQPNFSIPLLNISDVVSGGNLISGTYQFAVQYSDAAGNPYTSYYSITNPTPIANINEVTVNFNYSVGKSILINVSHLDITGQFQYFNLAVLKTINAITSVELLGTYFIDNTQKVITYTGQNVENIRLAISDIFEKYPYYDIAQDVTAVQDILVWDQLTSIDRINYQDIANRITLQWETYRIPASENYSDELNATNLRGYLRDEVYAFEIVFLLKNGKQTDGFHIPGRIRALSENRPDIADSNPDFIGSPSYTAGGIGYSPYWEIYNTASVSGYVQGYSPVPEYKGAYQYGDFAYWESTEEYPCNIDVWGELAGQKIRHHKFPDVLVSPIYESKIFSSPNSMVMGNDAVFPIGVLLDAQQINALISSSTLTSDQKSDIIGYKIVRGDRGTNKSIIAKGILRNIGTYTREETEYFYPNYPYNDLKADAFLNSTNNAYSEICETWDINILTLQPDINGGPDYAELQYIDCNTNKPGSKRFYIIGTSTFCSITRPTITLPATGTVGYANYERWSADIDCGLCQGYRVQYDDIVKGITTLWIITYHEFSVVTGTGGVVMIGQGGNSNIHFIGIHTSGTSCDTSNDMPAINANPQHAYRQIFNSPETSFGQPFLGDILKLESVMFGAGKAHFVEVKKNAMYKLITEQAQKKALDSSDKLARATSPFNYTAMFTAYQAYLTIYINGITRKNFAYSFNSIADYNYEASIPNDLGIKQRNLDIKKYLIPGVQSVGDIHSINNYERETSVFLKTVEQRNSLAIPALPFPDKTPSLIPGGVSIVTDNSRYTISEIGSCNAPAKENPIQVVSYYASLKNQIVNQWGQLYSYNTIDTGFQKTIDDTSSNTVVFGGDTFISRFAFKTKLPFFIDSRVNAPDDSDIFYDELGNVAYPKYWHSARSIVKDYTLTGVGVLSNIISYKAHNFDCPNDSPYVTPTTSTSSTSSTTTTTTTVLTSVVTPSSTLMYYDGYFYMFAYGIPNFYCESSYNIDLRQAFNNREGDFYPHVTTSIPDDWVQEYFVPIAQDNTYYYNITFSKQNKENSFSHLPPNWSAQFCYTYYPFRTVYSDSQEADADNKVNNWLSYGATSFYDFPQNYGNLTSLDGIQNRAILARFENKSLLYNNLLTMDTSNPQAAYLGNPNMFKNPPIDFAETDLGYVGSQHKMLLKIPQGQITIDAKRGQIFLLSGQQAIDLSAFGSGMNRFFTDHLAFEILRWFPTVDVDNNFTSIGLHAVYDSKYDRVIITKLDYIPLTKDIKYDEITRTFYIEKILNTFVLKTQVFLTDALYFCNKSWTLSYHVNTKAWISFHSYIPNWYIAENNFFYSGINGCCDEFDFIAGILTNIDCSLEGVATYGPDCSLQGIAISPLDCSLSGIANVILNCNLSGSATKIEPVCQRPMGLTNFYPIFGYTTPSTGITIVSSGSSTDACLAVGYMNVFGGIYIDVIWNSFTMQTTSISLGMLCYLGTSTDCSLAPDGWYFTEESALSNLTFHIVSGVITEIIDCLATTTTTTTTIPVCYEMTMESTDSYNANFVYTTCEGFSETVSVAPGFPYIWCCLSVDLFTTNGMYTVGSICTTTTSTTLSPP